MSDTQTHTWRQRHTSFVSWYEAKCGLICCSNAFSWAGEGCVGVLTQSSFVVHAGGWVMIGCQSVVAEEDRNCLWGLNVLCVFRIVMCKRCERGKRQPKAHRETIKLCLIKQDKSKVKPQEDESNLTVEGSQVVWVSKFSRHRDRLTNLHIGLSAR